jgi:tetratricopeptide (TPR) repeat protein
MASFGTSSRARLALLTVFATGILGGACVTQGSPQPEALSSGQLIERADAMFGARNTLETLEAYKLAAVSAQREGNGALFAEATAQVASVLALSAQPTAARNWLDQAQIATNPKEPQAWSRVLLARGLVLQAEGARVAAHTEFELLWTLALEMGHPDRAMQAAWMASGTAPRADRLRWSERCVEIARSTGNPRWEASAIEGMAWVQDDLGMRDEAVVSFEASLKLMTRSGSNHERLRAQWALGRAQRLAGRTVEARSTMEQTLAAAQQLQRTVFSPNDAEWVARCHSEMAELCALDADHDAALRHLRIARTRYDQADAELLAPEVIEDLDDRVRELELEQAGLRSPNL